ncbi:M48 family metallopeptidase [Roseofilum sp. BLCC_M154]|uniref:M48 family metallopeptidase n=1 Tax=Roseofilum acuticapitatum BLCC-M154 TaxID=3022444 RepID=A0ABT7ARK7_9CYAN|nr:M48 family metallopeptidase [Roseofilum acuticapitatum]MDJ1169539.1 M48 family metallopeptidase [Roseofilum acuticapitatum BLCC-M154]
MVGLMKQLWFRRWIYPLISLGVALGIGVSSPQMSQGFSIWDILPDVIQYVQLASLGDRQEIALGKQINQQLIRQEVRIYDDPELTDYINRIGQRLAQESYRPPTSNYKYTFQVVDDDSVNAFATLGGFVYIHTGLIEEAENEAELASVIGHEIAHIAERHAINQMRRMALTNGLVTAAGVDQSQIVGLGVEIALRLPHSRDAEYEADRVGLNMLTAAGYAQIGMVDFMHKLARSPSMPTFLSTHPHTRDRINALEQAIDPEFAAVGDGLDPDAYQYQIASLNGESGDRSPSEETDEGFWPL